MILLVFLFGACSSEGPAATGVDLEPSPDASAARADAGAAGATGGTAGQPTAAAGASGSAGAAAAAGAGAAGAAAIGGAGSAGNDARAGASGTAGASIQSDAGVPEAGGMAGAEAGGDGASPDVTGAAGAYVYVPVCPADGTGGRGLSCATNADCCQNPQALFCRSGTCRMAPRPDGNTCVDGSDCINDNCNVVAGSVYHLCDGVPTVVIPQGGVCHGQIGESCALGECDIVAHLCPLGLGAACTPSVSFCINPYGCVADGAGATTGTCR